MQKIQRVASLRDALLPARKSEKTIALVATMGALHHGHADCIRMARERSDVTVVSVFVNPAQFSPGEDLAEYPRTLSEDLAMCQELGCDVVFVPDASHMYPSPQEVWVTPGELALPLCGRTRKHHFRGVCTVVAKLFNMAQPDIAVFGQKDAQQVLVIRDMVRQLDMPVEIVSCPVAREEDGLAWSSRNRYLTRADRRLAPALRRSLLGALDLIRKGEREPDRVTGRVRAALMDAGVFDVEYVEIVDTERLARLPQLKGRVLLAMAVRIGSTRLIDNIAIDIPDQGPPEEANLF